MLIDSCLENISTATKDSKYFFSQLQCIFKKSFASCNGSILTEFMNIKNCSLSRHVNMHYLKCVNGHVFRIQDKASFSITELVC